MESLVPSSPAVTKRMSRQPRRDTPQELAVRQILHRAGLRYRIHVPVPGMPRRSIDIAFTKYKVAVFLDGCFWHKCPNHTTSPKANAAWWRAKLDRNVMRDRETTEHLSALGWVVLRFWEHEVPTAVAERVHDVVMTRRQADAG
ncbi:very short patch repair endonuclease [Streptomyces sp. NPDC006624]|uniref:very short patch repair endonuclease n=1 Tax=Streptomyces sp. NPDC006624 TaxID=3154892 RepID=UPI0033B011AC